MSRQTIYGPERIKRIAVKGFQSLRNVEIEPGRFTVLLGESDLGKSAFIRAINAAARNQAGQEFISYGEKTATVEIETEGETVVWMKDKSATYEVYEKDAASGEELFRPIIYEKARSVPDRVAASLRLGSVECGDVGIEPSFHTQFDAPFLVADTSSIRAKVVGELSGINLLFVATQEARRREGQARRLEGQRFADLEKQRLLLETYDDLPERGRRLACALTALQQIGECETRINTIADVAAYIQRFAAILRKTIAERDTLHDQLAAFDGLAKPAEADTHLVGLTTAMPQLAAALRAKKAAHAELAAEIARLDAKLAEVEVCPTCGRPL